MRRALVVVALLGFSAGCGPSDHATAVQVVLEQQLADSSKPERLAPLHAEQVTVIADTERIFPKGAAALVDVELATADGSHTHVVIRDGSKSDVSLADLTGLRLTTDPPCCIGPLLSSALLVDDGGLVAAGFESRGLDVIEGTGLTLKSGGAQSLPSFSGCASVSAIAVNVVGDSTITLASGESGVVKAMGNDVFVENGSSEHVDTHCTDSIAGDVMSWTAARNSLR